MAPVTVDGDQSKIKAITIAGTTGESKRIEALKITANNLPAGASIEYQDHVQRIGWQAPVIVTGKQNINTLKGAGTEGQSLRMEAFKITLKGLPRYAIKY